MKTPEEKAQAYVKSLDYIFPENMDIAGNAYLAGYRAALDSEEVKEWKELAWKYKDLCDDT